MRMINDAYKKEINNITSKYTLYLSSTPRYARYIVDESLREWVSILGPDVLLLTHGDTTAKIAEQFILHDQIRDKKLSKEEKSDLILASYIHDWGEIIIENEGIGDITFEQKNEAIEEMEGVIFNKVISSIKDEAIKEKFHKTYQGIAMNRNTRLGEIFNVIERLGYLETAIRAFKGNQSGKRIKNWRGLVGNVFSNQPEKLLIYSKKYSYVNFVMKKESKKIDKIFQEIIDTPTPIDNTRNPSYDQKKLQNSYSVWIKRG